MDTVHASLTTPRTPAGEHPPQDERLPAIELLGVEKLFHSHGSTTTAVGGVDLEIGEGEFFSLLGPSGCGKTTTLRMIGGFDQPTAGRILLYGQDVVGVPPNRRDVNMVFQSYALFPHLSVFENIAYGLRRKGVPSAERSRRVAQMLELVQLEAKSDQRPRELSGGQQQRVALARALVNRPRALLLDEPLAALDLKLRQAMQLELKRIQREVGITFVFVTHDQNEALTLSDRLAVMNAGQVEQAGRPREVYEHPQTRFVAGFIGTSNLLSRRVRAIDGTTAVLEAGPDERLVVPGADLAQARVGDVLDLTVRPEKISILRVPATDPSACVLRGTVTEVVYLGTATQYAVAVTASGDRTGSAGSSDLIVFRQNAADATDVAARGDDVWLSWRPEHSLALRPGPSAASGSDPAASPVQGESDGAQQR